MTTDNQIITAKNPEETFPSIDFFLIKAGEIDKKFVFTFSTIYGSWSDRNPFAYFLDTYLECALEEARQEKQQRGYFTSPFLLRYALVGHGGCRLYLSPPKEMIYCFTPPLTSTKFSYEYDKIILDVHLFECPYFILKMYVGNTPGRWTDRVKYIEIYISPLPDPGKARPRALGCKETRSDREEARPRAVTTPQMSDHHTDESIPISKPGPPPFFLLASIDSLKLDQSRLVIVPVASTLISDLQGYKLLDTISDIEDGADQDIDGDKPDTMASSPNISLCLIPSNKYLKMRRASAPCHPFPPLPCLPSFFTAPRRQPRSPPSFLCRGGSRAPPSPCHAPFRNA